MRILNLYAGIGGNRKLWSDDHEVTAVEFNPEIAEIYAALYKNDKVIVRDAHQYLLDNYKSFDFIWSPPPCPSHSRLNTFLFPNGSKEICFPDLKLYEEILFLQHWFKGQFCVENVIPYYEPLIPGKVIDRHLFWTNFKLSTFKPIQSLAIKGSDEIALQKLYGFDLRKFKVSGKMMKRKILRNCVHPETGLHILNCAIGKYQSNSIKQLDIFNYGT